MTQTPSPVKASPSNSNSACIDSIAIEAELPYPRSDVHDISNIENPYKLADTVLWKRPEVFQPGFLEQHKDVILYDILNHIKAFLLYPPLCKCDKLCLCTDKRHKVILSLNTHSYNKIEMKRTEENLFPARFFLNIPEDHFFRKNSGDLYPLWLIQEGFQKSETVRKRIDQLVWTLLKLARTCEISPLRSFQASVEKALEILLGKGPLKTHTENQKGSLGGEKAYRETFKVYKSLCPFIAAFNMMKENGPEMPPEDDGEDDPWEDPHTIEHFLKVAHFFRKTMLRVTTPNVKGQSLFSEETLFSLPPWIHSDDIDIPLHPFEDKLLEIRKMFSEAFS